MEERGPEERPQGLGWREGAVIAEGVAGIGCIVLVIVLGALGLGLWLDNLLGTRPWLTLGLVVLSIPVSLVALVYGALRTARRIQAPGTEGKGQPYEGEYGE